MDVSEKELLDVIRTLESIEVRGSENLSMLYASIIVLKRMVSSENKLDAEKPN